MDKSIKGGVKMAAQMPVLRAVLGTSGQSRGTVIMAGGELSMT